MIAHNARAPVVDTTGPSEAHPTTTRTERQQFPWIARFPGSLALALNAMAIGACSPAVIAKPEPNPAVQSAFPGQAHPDRVKEFKQIADAFVEDNGNDIPDDVDIAENDADDVNHDGQIDSWGYNVPRYANLYRKDWHAELPRNALWLWRTYLPTDSVLIRCIVPRKCSGRLCVNDSTGIQLRLLDEDISAGPHEFNWDRQADGGRTLPGGHAYYIVLEVAGDRLTRRVRWGQSRD